MALETIIVEDQAGNPQPVTVDDLGAQGKVTVVKLAIGADGSIALIEAGNPLPTTPDTERGAGAVTNKTTRVTVANDGPLMSSLGAINASAAAPDGLGDYGVIQALKRSLLNGAAILARLPSLIAGRIPVDGSGVTQPVSGPLTDAQLRASAVPIAGNVGVSGPVAVSASALPIGAATEATAQAIRDRLPSSSPTTTPDFSVAAQPVRQAPQDVITADFSAVGASVLDSVFSAPVVTGGVTYNQAAGSLNVVAGTTANGEFLARSSRSFRGSMRLRFTMLASQRIVNNNFAVLLADLIGEGLTFNIVNGTTVDVTIPAHGFTSQNVGQFVLLGGITGAAGVPGRYAIASLPDLNTVRFTVAGWPASGSGPLTAFGRNYIRHLFTGTTATAVNVDAQRNGWASGDTAATINSTASPGTLLQTELTGRDVFFADSLRATSTTPNFTTRASRYENVPDQSVDLFVFLWNFNGTTAPASSTTFTLGHVVAESYANFPVYVQGFRAQGAVNPIPVSFATTPTIVVSSITTNTPTLAAGTNRAGFVAGSGIWWDDSAVALAAAATFTGTARDLIATATATAFNSASTYASEMRVAAEADQAGTLWVEISRDNTNWRRAYEAPTAARTGGGQFAEIVFKPAWRYARVGFTNGATLQGRFSIGSVALAAV